MIVANKKSTTAASNIMPSPLSIKDTSIKIESLLFTFLKNIAHNRRKSPKNNVRWKTDESYAKIYLQRDSQMITNTK